VLARKDLRVYFRDRTAVLLGFGLPIVLATVFGGAMGAIGGGDGVGRVELVVQDDDQSDASRELIAELKGSKGLRIDLLDPAEEATARQRVAEGDSPAGLFIGSGFGAALEDGATPPLTLYRDPGKTIEQQIIAGNLIPAFFGAMGERAGKLMGRKILETVDFPLIGRERAQSILDESWERMESLVGELEPEPEPEPAGAPQDGTKATTEAEDDDEDFDFASGVAEVFGVAVEDVVGGDEHSAAQRRAQQANAVAGMAVMMLLFGLIACGGTLLSEEADGTLDRLRLAPGSPRAILIGKFLFTWTVGLAQLVILFLYGRMIFDVPIFEAPVALVVLSAAVAAACTGFGVLFAVLARSQKQLEGLSTIVVLTMSALGGSWWPLAITPEWYQFLGHFTLNAWAMDGYQALFWYGQGLTGILTEVGVLLGIAAVTMLLALRLFDWRLAVR